jgi:hypothetical protein
MAREEGGIYTALILAGSRDGMMKALSLLSSPVSISWLDRRD